jgi:hypothetical protein
VIEVNYARRKMKAPAVFLLLSLLAAFHAPLAGAASDPGMDCCADGTAGMMCCPISGSCSMRGCGTDEPEALLSTMSVFLLPAAAGAALRPAASSLAQSVEARSPVCRASRVPDPPPRG